MRVMVLFDLPMTSSIDLKSYRHFRNNLLHDGFIMFQESVYVRLALNITSANAIKHHVSQYAPNKGHITIIVLTEKQFNNIVFISGEAQNTVIDSTERMIVL
ncbi:MAG: CRISPR-associated endonuclease Cas2 [Erysipelotrichaceae bacterium]